MLETSYVEFGRTAFDSPQLDQHWDRGELFRFVIDDLKNFRIAPEP